MYRRPLRRLLDRLARSEPVPLSEIDPVFAEELWAALLAAGEPRLARAVFDLTVADPCPCDDPLCAGFYTVDRFRAAWYWRKRGRTIPLSAGLSVDVVGGRIIAVEVHDRPTLKSALTRLGRTDDAVR
jgi:hypothetical protein